jgi:hypothetical protein
MNLTDDDAIAWVKIRHIRVVTKPTMIGNQQGWRFRVLRAEPKDSSREELKFNIPGSQKPGMAEVLQFISNGAWEKFLTRRRGPLSDNIWTFFLQTELRELYELSRD